MKILLQNRETSRYLAQGGRWSENMETALSFTDLAQARQYGARHGLPGLRIVALAGGESTRARCGRAGGKEHNERP